MIDTQWPRFEVFQQDRPEGPHRSVGSVHAPDAEMALLNARDVFVRRPACYSLWVVPEEAIYSRTGQEIKDNYDLHDPEIDSETEKKTYYVFQKQSQRRSMSFVIHTGQVEAASPIQALNRAIASFGESSTYVWWVCPEEIILKSLESDAASMFEPAGSKTYRMPREYRVVSEMLVIKREPRGRKDS